MRLIHACCWLLPALIAAQAAAATPASRPVPLAERLGVCHVAGKYNFTKGDFLNEGADLVLAAGLKVIKVYMSNPAGDYAFDKDWPKFKHLTEMARHPRYQELFKKPFKAFVLTTFCPAEGLANRWRKDSSPEFLAEVRAEYYELTKYLLKTYKGSGKTFVFQNWEGDWALRGCFSADPKDDPSPEVIVNMTRWMNARQDGVDKARAEVKAPGVFVYNALEANLVAIAMQDRPSVVNDVFPQTHCDLYSYSAYDTIGVAAGDPAKGRELFLKALEHMAAKAPNSPAFGERNIYVGEFGWPEVASEQDKEASAAKSVSVLRMTVEAGTEWGCPYLLFWQAYDNEVRSKQGRPTNADCRGFYLVRPDGTSGPAWDYFTQLIHGKRISPPAWARGKPTAGR